MKRSAVIVSALLSLACSKDPADAIEAYSEEVCECENAECVEKVRKSWEDENVERIAASELSDEQASRIQTAITAALECQNQFE